MEKRSLYHGGTMNKKNRKRAGVTVEVTLSTLLALTVLFLILNMFTSNIKAMIANSGMQNMFNRDNSYEKTDFKNVKTDRTQIGVQTVGDQGSLAWWNKQAVDNIQKLSEKSPLTDADKIDLARWLTIYAESGNLGGNEMLNQQMPNSTQTYSSLQANYIKIQLGQSFIKSYLTQVTLGDGRSLFYNWDKENITNESNLVLYTANQTNDNASSNPKTSTEQKRIANIEAIKTTFDLIK
jgi:hypothetical protein